MNCRRSQQLLFDFIDGFSNEALRAELDRHLGECPACEKFAVEMTRSLALLKRAPVATLDENFNWKVRLAIHRERNAMRSGSPSPGSWARAWSFRYAAGAGIAFALVLVSGVVLQRNVMRADEPATVSKPFEREEGTSLRDVASNPARPQTRPGRMTSPTISGPETLVSGGTSRHSLLEDTPLGAIDDPERSEALIDSLVERQLIPLAPEERARYIERQIHRLQSRLRSQQAPAVRP